MVEKDWWELSKNCSKQKRSDAQKEVMVVGLISISPLVLAVISKYLLGQIDPIAQPVDFFASIAALIFSGQLLFYAMSFVGVVAWYSSQELMRPFPLRIWFVLSCIMTRVFCGLILGVDPTLEKLNNPLIWILSVVIYYMTAKLYYYMILFRSLDETDFEAAKNKDTDTFQKDVSAAFDE